MALWKPGIPGLCPIFALMNSLCAQCRLRSLSESIANCPHCYHHVRNSEFMSTTGPGIYSAKSGIMVPQLVDRALPWFMRLTIHKGTHPIKRLA